MGLRRVAASSMDEDGVEDEELHMFSMSATQTMLLPPMTTLARLDSQQQRKRHATELEMGKEAKPCDAHARNTKGYFGIFSGCS